MMMDNIIDRRDEFVQRRSKHIADLRKRANEADAKLQRLYEAIENGLADPGDRYRRIRMTSGFGRMTIGVSDGALPWPYGRDTTGYEVADLDATLAKATAAGAAVLVPAFTSGDRRSAMVQFPGGYIAEIHMVLAR